LGRGTGGRGVQREDPLGRGKVPDERVGTQRSGGPVRKITSSGNLKEPVGENP